MTGIPSHSADKPKKRKPPRATLEQKIRILDYFHQSTRPQSETVETFKNEVAISTSTFNEWLKHEEDYRERYRDSETPFEKHARRKVTYKYDQINRAMDLLVQQRLASNEEITEPILRNYWQIYAHQFGVEDPKRLVGFSHGWLNQFKKRHGLSKPRGAEISQETVTRTTLSNEKLLANSCSEEVSDVDSVRKIALDENTEMVLSKRPDPYSHFEPQSTLSFPPSSYLSPDSNSNEKVNKCGPSPSAETAESLEAAMKLSLNTQKSCSAGDIEQFFLNVADQFFQNHQYDYPQTMHLYKEFKSSFVSERLINLRSAEKRAVELELSSGPPILKRVHHNSRNNGVSIQALLHQDPVQLAADERLQARRIRDNSDIIASSALDSRRDQIGVNPRDQPGDSRRDQRDQGMDHLLEREIPQDFISLRRLRPQCRTNDVPIESSGINIESSSHTHTPEDRVGMPHRAHNHTHHGHLQQLRIAQAQIEHVYTTEGTPSIVGEQNVENWLLRQDKPYTREENWPNSQSRKLWEQNKIMLS